ncbi:uncharacterized protein LOC141913239 [Tubulanus polymorphus]|uniref:uncharacterized protein LOC141913239 n=1 Tax=Tubulanus polymorphus TaxID=672921 RepID=UPI003DA4E035
MKKPQLSLSVLCFISLILLQILTASARRLDCRKYVFAPRCRGVSAKRSSDANSVDESLGVLSELTRAIPSDDDDDVDLVPGRAEKRDEGDITWGNTFPSNDQQRLRTIEILQKLLRHLSSSE